MSEDIQSKLPEPKPEQAQPVPAIDEKNVVPTPDKNPEHQGKVGEDREPGALLQQGHDENELVNLQSVISDEFGTHRPFVKMELAQSKVYVDGELFEGDPFAVPYPDIVDKKILVKGPFRTYEFKYVG